MASKKIITVVGATGNQGAGVLSVVIGNPEYHVRALTRHSDSCTARELSAKGVEVVAADIDDVESLKAAFSGSHIIYAITNFFEPFAKFGAEKAAEIETQQGVNLARAASATPTLQHYIWSTLPDIVAISGGKYAVPHYVAKNKVDAFIRLDAGLLKKTTLLWITWYHSNYKAPPFTPYFIPTAHKYVQFADYSPATPISTIGDVRSNVGPFVEAILANPARTRNGAVVKAEIEDPTAGELLQRWGKATGNDVVFVRTDAETFNGLWPILTEELGEILFWDEFRDKSWTVADGTVLTKEDLGVDTSKFVPLEESLKTLKL
ncbi:hypothetical protein QQX98_000906 [Neonectria punicea]|uniref:NmrA-like domain-containing protein n=1 Tax=Neonectria punicea TaxID=979145 RepID=A0ABR1HRE7_9HYPO